MTDSSPSLDLRAPAKINLGLEVLRRRPDGFHDINTLFASLALHDRIRLRGLSDGHLSLTVTGDPTLESDDRNLCLRAARLLRDSIGDETLGLQIELAKNIPTGAGLGGGSSDAAAVLLGGARLWGLRSDLPTLHELAGKLGSDVPFFLHRGIMLGESRGERLTPIDLTLPFSILLVNPGIHVPTPWAYQAIGRNDERPASDLVGSLRRGLDDPFSMRRAIGNDFEPAVFAEYPQLEAIKEELYRRGGFFASMSGSGSTMFALFEQSERASLAAEAFPEYWTTVTGFES